MSLSVDHLLSSDHFCVLCVLDLIRMCVVGICGVFDLALTQLVYSCIALTLSA